MADQDVTPNHWPARVKRPGERRNVSRSATRALDVLEQFGQVRKPLRAVDIVRQLGLHPSTVNQLLKTMVESAHLTFDATTKTYLPSPRLARFSSWVIETYGTDGKLRELMQRVHSASGEVVTLTTPNDIHMQIVDIVDMTPPAGGSSGAERGLQVSMFGSAIGAAYLATVSDAEVDRLAYRARLSEQENAALLSWIEQVRRNGIADASSAEGNIWSVAVALAPAPSRAPLILGLAGPSERVRSRLGELSRLLEAAALDYRRSAAQASDHSNRVPGRDITPDQRRPDIDP